MTWMLNFLEGSSIELKKWRPKLFSKDKLIRTNRSRVIGEQLDKWNVNLLSQFILLYFLTVLSLKFNENCTETYIFLKKHNVRDQSSATPKDRTLFIQGLPPYTTKVRMVPLHPIFKIKYFLKIFVQEIILGRRRTGLEKGSGFENGRACPPIKFSPGKNQTHNCTSKAGILPSKWLLIWPLCSELFQELLKPVFEKFGKVHKIILHTKLNVKLEDKEKGTSNYFGEKPKGVCILKQVTRNPYLYSKQVDKNHFL